MYLYIYDAFLRDKKYAKILTKIEARLTDLGIKGKIIKLSLLRNIGEVIKDALRQGARTIVAVGNDKTLTQIVNSLSDFNITLGYVPMAADLTLARILGIPPFELACEVIANRLLQSIDLGKINNIYFLSQVEAENGEIVVSHDGKYAIRSTDPGQTVRVMNLGYAHSGSVYNPLDGKLEITFEQSSKKTFRDRFSQLIQPREKSQSVFPMTKLKLEHADESIPVVVDGCQVMKTPAIIEIAPKQLKVIVGKERLF